MSNILKGQRGLSPILKSIKSVNGAKEATKTASKYQKIIKASPKTRFIIPSQQFESARKNYHTASGEFEMLIEPMPYIKEIFDEAKSITGLDKAENTISSQIIKLESQLPALQAKSDQIYKTISSYYETQGWQPDFDFKSYADQMSGLSALEDEIIRWKDIDRGAFYNMKDWNRLNSLKSPIPIVDDLPYKNGGKLKSIF